MSERGENLAQASFPEMEEAKAALHGLEGLESEPSQDVRAYDGPRDDFRETIYWNGNVETNANGDADVAFVASDSVTSFRATAEGFGTAGGIAGGGSATFQAKLPLTLDAHLPVEVTSGDTINLPVTIANETDDALDAKLDAKFGAAFKLASNPIAGAIHLGPKQKQSLFFQLQVVATDGASRVRTTGESLPRATTAP